MDSTDPAQSASLSMPHRRDELIVYLRELELPDPRTAWQEESERGLASGVDEVFHFFFDDNDFDQTAIGVTLLNPFEVAAIEKLKSSLEAVLDSVGDRGDDAFVEHPLWRQVTAAAADARCHLGK
jgi:hypothetical protein